MSASSPKTSVRIVEVGPRDGLQNIAKAVPTATKTRLIELLRKAGHRTIEVTSVVSKRAVPQLGDCDAVLRSAVAQTLISEQASEQDLIHAPVLVPNLRGLNTALKHGVREVAVFVSATEGFSMANIKCSVSEGLERAHKIVLKAKDHGVLVRGYVSCVFADPYDGPTYPGAVLSVVERLLSMGCYEISLGDTTGVGSPENVRSLLSFLSSNKIPFEKLAGHFHDTYGQAVANVWEAYKFGLRVFDSSVAGLGGCPFAPGAKGNVATEDIVYMFHQAGISTDVDLLELTRVGVWIASQLALPNSSRAGPALAVKHGLQPIRHNPPRTIRWEPVTDVQTTDGLKVYRSGVILKIVLDRPRNGNALTEQMLTHLTELFTRLKDDTYVTRVVLAANGKFFCTGMDLGNGSSPVAQEDDSAAKAQYERLTNLFEAIDRAPQVTIASINGPAFGGGVGLAFTCDIRLAAADSAAVRISEARLGLCPATISKYILREWGPAFTRDAMLSARSIPARELKEHGLISALAPNNQALEDLVNEYLIHLRETGPRASTMCKDLVRTVQDGSEAQAATIKELFLKMMRHDGEAAYGLKQFQAGVKSLDWDAALLRKSGSQEQTARLKARL